ncbi:hypothetical protein RHSIM_RhsimUnG0203100 [Rhododendron simsii]|uniref:Uncharacterized protein n=1 Tax=Rhododendron simsii TaxID=118357 RepID=A0A834L268_RHOSS|nr:hypothetical protein RHSIM_RhsimUnG0203100 [Rhododendron simsii]
MKGGTRTLKRNNTCKEKAKVLIATNVDKKIDATVNLNVAGIIYVVKVIEEESCQVPLSVEFSQPAMTALPIHLKTSEKDAEKEDHEKGDDSVDLDVVADSCNVNIVNNEVHKEVILKEVTALIMNNNCLLEIENDNTILSGEVNKQATNSSLVAEPPHLLLEAPFNSTVNTVLESDLDSRVEDSLDFSNEHHSDSSFPAHLEKPNNPSHKLFSDACPLVVDSSLSEPLLNDPAHSGEPSHSGIMCSQFILRESQLNGISLQVDLKTTQGRKLRRGQLLNESEANLNTSVIPSMQDLEPNPIQSTQNSTTSASVDIDSEVSSTFEVGTRLDINCKAKDKAIVHKMILEETEEF